MLTQERAKEIHVKQAVYPYWGNYERFMTDAEKEHVTGLYIRARSGFISKASVIVHIMKGTNTPVFGLMVRRRAYECQVCGHIHPISTNHTSGVFSQCPNCYWRSGYDKNGNHYRAGLNKKRPHVYAGIMPGPDEFNPHAIKLDVQ